MTKTAPLEHTLGITLGPITRNIMDCAEEGVVLQITLNRVGRWCAYIADTTNGHRLLTPECCGNHPQDGLDALEAYFS